MLNKNMTCSKAILRRATRIGLLCWLVLSPAIKAATYVDDFSRPSMAWRYGYKIWTEVPGPLVFGRGRRDMTLSGATMNPQNMIGFSVDARFRFGNAVSPKLVLGWGKPHEWDGINECQGKLWVESAGKFTLQVDGKSIEWGIAACDAGRELFRAS